jgi:hypothetical protein
MTAEERIAECKRKIAACDAEESESEIPRMMAAALIYGGSRNGQRPHRSGGAE